MDVLSLCVYSWFPWRSLLVISSILCSISTYPMDVGTKTANYFTELLPTSFIATESQRWHEGFIAWGKYKNSPPPLVLPGAASAQGRQQGCGAVRQHWGWAVLGEAGLSARPSCPLHAEAFEVLPNDEHPSCTPLHEQRHIDHMDWGARLVSSIVIFIWKALKSTLKKHPDLWNVVSLLGWKTGFFTRATPCEVKLVNTLQGSGSAEIILHPD